MPKQVGKFILDLAKLRMLQFYYLFLDAYIDRKDYQICWMDTDSFYISLSAPIPEMMPPRHQELDFHPLATIVKPDMRDKFGAMLKNYCTDSWQPDPTIHYFPRQCCAYHNIRDQKQHGLFKEENVGVTAICTAPKVHGLYDKDGRLVKCANKGLIKEQNKGIMTEGLKRVMIDAQPICGTNISKRVHPMDKRVYTYQQDRTAISYLYVNRRILKDGIHTEPLY